MHCFKITNSLLTLKIWIPVHICQGHSLKLNFTRIQLFKSPFLNRPNNLPQMDFLLTLLKLKVLTFFKLWANIHPQILTSINKVEIFLKFIIIMAPKFIIQISNFYLDNMVVHIISIDFLVEIYLHNLLLE